MLVVQHFPANFRRPVVALQACTLLFFTDFTDDCMSRMGKGEKRQMMKTPNYNFFLKDESDLRNFVAVTVRLFCCWKESFQVRKRNEQNIGNGCVIP